MFTPSPPIGTLESSDFRCRILSSATTSTCHVPDRSRAPASTPKDRRGRKQSSVTQLRGSPKGSPEQSDRVLARRPVQRAVSSCRLDHSSAPKAVQAPCSSPEGQGRRTVEAAAHLSARRRSTEWDRSPSAVSSVRLTNSNPVGAPRGSHSGSRHRTGRLAKHPIAPKRSGWRPEPKPVPHWSVIKRESARV
jgi:hypothetical protein